MKKPLIGIIMGSDSDLPVMRAAADVCEEFGVPFEITILSAHRTSDQTIAYAKSAQKRGLQIIIAGAGGAAHLAGVVAGVTPLPVIGVPIESKSLKGLDSLLATVQMPPGVPVATVAINGAKNAGLLAIKMLALSDEALDTKVVDYMQNQAEKVLAKAKKLEKVGYKKYIK
ncbi:5-(carboxyamino)imidazole ribonucleotide mutase [Candidatus Microgenomates bacterium]|nr:MAG: 5-(carboxyamino)imidazole ribonucleotide mutase [Candidatus Microgenomates bacterium]